MEWRLILDSPRSASHNMAKDEVCLRRAVSEGQGVIRLYGWEGLVLSVGRNQRVDRQIDLEACREAGIPLIRRITGGRAVLHGEDLTYSVAGPTGRGGFATGIMEIYREISKVFQTFFRELGFDPEVKAYSGRERAEMASAVCFSTPSAFEIVIGGKKIVGSAQRLLADGFLQHGSLPLRPQHHWLARVFKGVSEREVGEQMTDLETLGVWGKLDLEQIRQRLVDAFGKSLGVTPAPAAWGERDDAAVAALEPAYPLLTAYQEPAGGPKGAAP